MLGSTVAATDAAAVFAVLRGSTLRRADRPHARGRVRRQRPGRDPARDRLHRDRQASDATGCSNAIWLAVSELAIGAAVGLAVGAAGRDRPAPRDAALRRPVPGRLGRVRGHRLRRRGHRSHGSGFLAVFLAGLVIGCGSSPARRTMITFHEGLAWVAQLALFLLLGLLVNPARADRVHPRGHRDRHRHGRDRAAAGGAAGRVRLHACRSGCSWAGPDCEARPRSCSRRSPSPKASTHGERSSRSRSSSCCSRRSCRG